MRTVVAADARKRLLLGDEGADEDSGDGGMVWEVIRSLAEFDNRFPGEISDLVCSFDEVEVVV